MNDWTIVVISLIFSAFFSGMEIAFISSNKLKIELDKNKGLISANILAHFVSNPSRILGTLLLGNNIALVVYGISMARILEPVLMRLIGDRYGTDVVILIIQTIISTLIILITAEFLPKALFRLRANSMLKLFAVPLNFFYWILYPVIHGIVGLSEFIIRKFSSNALISKSFSFSPVDLDHYLREFLPDQREEQDIKQEIQMLQNALGFKSVKLRECMLPRTEIIALETNEPIGELQKLFIESGHSKIPIFRDNIDNIIGFVHTSDMFNNPVSISSIIRSVPVFPESMFAHHVLSTFIRDHKSIAVVVDEFGGTSGIVTMEDIMEEIFGEIDDEYDVEELREEKIEEKTYLLSARHEIDYLNQKYKFGLPESDEYETLGGLIIKIHESIPVVNEVIRFGSFKFIIREATERRIEMVELRIDEMED